MKNSVLTRMALTLAVVLMAVATLNSCRRIQLYYPSSGVYLNVKYIKPDPVISPDIDISGHEDLYNKIYGKQPESYRVCFYDPTTHKLVAEDYIYDGGGFLSVEPGIYDILVYSLGNETTLVTGTGDRDAGYAYTNNSETPEPAPECCKIIFEPDHLFVGKIEGVEIPVMPEESEPHTIFVDASTLLETYTIDFTDVEGIDRIRYAEIYLTGQAESKYLWDRHYRGTICTLQSEAYMSKDKGNIYTVFNTFGKYPSSEGMVFLNLSVIDKSGARHQWLYDVTDQFEAGATIIEVYDKIVIPEGGDGEGGFTEKVEKWRKEETDVPIM